MPPPDENRAFEDVRLPETAFRELAPGRGLRAGDPGRRGGGRR